MTRLGIPAGKQGRLVDLMIKRFNEALRDLTRRRSRFRRHAGPVRGGRYGGRDGQVPLVQRDPSELGGFRDVAARFRRSILQAVPLVV